jgi:hypothetical protein
LNDASIFRSTGVNWDTASISDSNTGNAAVKSLSTPVRNDPTDTVRDSMPIDGGRDKFCNTGVKRGLAEAPVEALTRPDMFAIGVEVNESKKPIWFFFLPGISSQFNALPQKF